MEPRPISRRDIASPDRARARGRVPRRWRPLWKMSEAYVVGGAALVAIFAIQFGVVRLGVAADVAGPATPIACADLEAHGPGASRHVVLTRYFVCNDYVRVRRGQRDGEGHFVATELS